MTETQIAVASGATVALVQVLKMAGLSGRWAYIVAALASLATMLVFAFTRDVLTREDVWSLYIAYPVVLSAAAGVFNLVSSAPAQVASFKAAGEAATGALKRSAGMFGIGLMLVLIVGCGRRAPEIPTVPPALEPSAALSVDQSVQAAAGKALVIITAGLKLANRASDLKDSVCASGAAPATVCERLRSVFLTLGLEAKRAITAIESGALDTWPKLRAYVDPVVSAARSIVQIASDTASLRNTLLEWGRGLVDIFAEIPLEPAEVR